MVSDKDYHLQRAREERQLAYGLGDSAAGDAHLRLSALHLSRAMVMEEVEARLGSAREDDRPR